MYELRLNGVQVNVKCQTVTLFDTFGDLSEQEIHIIMSYLVEEGFINPEKEVNVLVKSKSFIPSAKKKSQKKN